MKPSPVKMKRVKAWAVINPDTRLIWFENASSLSYSIFSGKKQAQSKAMGWPYGEVVKVEIRMVPHTPVKKEGRKK